MAEEREVNAGTAPPGRVNPPAAGPRRLLWLASALAMVVAVFIGDYVTGDELSFSLIYLFPIAAGAWFVGRGAGVLLSFLSAAGWITSYLLVGRFYSNPWALYWNAFMEMGIFLIVALALSGIRDGFEKQRALNRQIEVAYERLDREQRIVGDIQRSLLPPRPPAIPGYEFAVHYATSTRAGGDYYDFFPLADGRTGLLIADVSGHGTPAAVVMAMMRVLVSVESRTLESPGRTLETLNARLVRHILQGQFATAFYATLDPRGGRLDWARAGHCPPFLARGESGRIEALAGDGGPPLGLSAPAVYEPQTTLLGPGDTLLLFTDGLTEAMDAGQRLFGEERVRELLVRHRGANPAALLERLLEAVRLHIGDAALSDDLSIVIVQAAPAAPRS